MGPTLGIDEAKELAYRVGVPGSFDTVEEFEKLLFTGNCYPRFDFGRMKFYVANKFGDMITCWGDTYNKTKTIDQYFHEWEVHEHRVIEHIFK